MEPLSNNALIWLNSKIKIYSENLLEKGYSVQWKGNFENPDGIYKIPLMIFKKGTEGFSDLEKELIESVFERLEYRGDSFDFIPKYFRSLS